MNPLLLHPVLAASLATMWIAIGIGVALVLLIGIVLVLRRRGGKDAPISIVLFRPAARKFSEADVRGAYRRAYSKEPQLQTIPMPDGLTNGFLLVHESIPPLAVINSARMYMTAEEAADVASCLEHQTAREAIRNHKAWDSVDAMGIDPRRVRGERRAKVYTLLGKLAAELHDEGCSLLYLPADNRVAQPGPAAEKSLREGKIAELFGDDSLHAPIFNVGADDAQINRAIEEARKRLPEFLGEFDRRGEATNAMFKARFPTGNGGNEIIWLRLQSVGASALRGTIENPPVDKSLPRKGQSVEVKLDAVVDWAYLDEKEEPQGLFVDRILVQRGHR